MSQLINISPPPYLRLLIAILLRRFPLRSLLAPQRNNLRDLNITMQENLIKVKLVFPLPNLSHRSRLPPQTSSRSKRLFPLYQTRESSKSTTQLSTNLPSKPIKSQLKVPQENKPLSHFSTNMPKQS